MIVDERIVTFINSMETENSKILEAIESEALSTYVPIIRKEMQSFLKVLLTIQKPMRILEVGTAVGFSALLMSEYAPAGREITTIEKYEKRTDQRIIIIIFSCDHMGRCICCTKCWDGLHRSIHI